MKRCFAYIRVSTIRQGHEGVSLEEQRDAISQFASRRDLEIIQWFEEKETASKPGRPIFGTMMRLLKKKQVEAVVFHKIDRSSRNPHDWADLGDLLDSGVDVHSAVDGLDLRTRGGRFAAEMLAVLAADYSRNLREEVLKGIHGRLKQGLWPFGAPVGYLDRGGGKPKLICPIRGPLVRQAFELYDTGGYSLLTLDEELWKRGLRSTGGKRVPFNRLCTVLHSPFYMGLMRLKSTGELFPGVHEALVSKALFERVQARLTGNRVGSGARRHHYLFRRLFRCRSCGHLLVGERQKDHVYYRCHTANCLRRCFREEDVEALIEKQLASFSFSKKEREYLLGLAPGLARKLLQNQQKSSANLEARLVRIGTRLAKLTDALIDGLITKDIFLERKKSLLFERRELEGKLENRPSAGRITETLRRILELANDALLSYRTGAKDQKRELVEILSSNRHATPEGLVIEPSNPFSLIGKVERLSSCGHDRNEKRTGKNLPKRKVRERTRAELAAMLERLGKWVKQNPDGFKGVASAEQAETS